MSLHPLHAFSDKPEELIFLVTLPSISLNCIRQNCTVSTKMTSTVVYHSSWWNRNGVTIDENSQWLGSSQFEQTTQIQSNQIDFNLFALTCLSWNAIVIEKEQDKSTTWIWASATWDCCNLVDDIRNVLSFRPQASLVVEHFWSFGLLIFNLFVFYSLIVWCFTLLSFALLIFNLLVFYSLIFWSTWAETATTKRRGRNLVRKIISLLKMYINWRVGFIINHFDLSVVIPPPSPQASENVPDFLWACFQAIDSKI